MIRRWLLGALLAATTAPAIAQDYRARLPEDEVIYFVLPDRFENGDPANDKGGLSGDRLTTGFDPAAKGFYHGGDLKGLIKRLDYIQHLGVTAIWVGPIFKNKPVQGPPGNESSGYHGYWITDFTQVDPHLGSNTDFKALVDAAHARGIKIYMDIIVNHTADVIKYRECVPDRNCPYRSKADFPFSRRGGVTGPAINPAFAGDAVQTPDNFAKLTDPSYAYTPYLPKGEEHAKTPDWLNDMTLYHNRGDSVWTGESVTYGDFSGLDDVATEHPKVVAGMIDIFGDWIDRFGIDGFRIDTAKHVNPEFWQAFVPAMQARAKAKGIPNFHIFGEVATGEFDPALLARHTRVDKLPAVLDFGFAVGVAKAVAEGKGTDILAELFADDALYEGGANAARTLPTFLGNHDAGRFSTFVRQLSPKADAAEQLARVKLAHAMLLTLRGVPTIYSGDEQGFVGDGGDQDAREDLFASKVASYNDNVLLGTKSTTAQANFDEAHPLYRLIADLAKLRVAHPALTRGRTVVRAASQQAGLFAVSRIDAASGEEVLLVFNTDTKPLSANVAIDPATSRLTGLRGACPAAPTAPGSVAVKLAPLDFMICKAERPQ
ncbi:MULTISPECIES: alpha-amylase family glycosyl hydrolase [Sphingomonas]|uniref:alpha-amylase family glycosyl hydrolase n=1 Tax=Sphingomonas TaxID=13687 RepID=UPI000834E2F3|nr:alpha-amylase family glycosyl hydrolase [Sphingomonas sp. CCH10-B3]